MYTNTYIWHCKQVGLQQQLDDAKVECKQAVMLKDLHIKRLEHQLAAQVCMQTRGRDVKLLPPQ